jgi:hypothetical protein
MNPDNYDKLEEKLAKSKALMEEPIPIPTLPPPVFEYPDDPDARIISLTRGQCTFIETQFYEWLTQWSWCAAWNSISQSFYALRGYSDDGIQRWISMQRQILGLKRGDPREADHALHNTLDNRRFVNGIENLRIATRKENTWNSLKPKNKKNEFKGVNNYGKNLYEAKITIEGNLVNLGTRSTAEAAFAELYIPAIRKHRGKFACAGSDELNKIYRVGPYDEDIF